MRDNDWVQEIVDQYGRVLNLYSLIEKTPKDFGTGNQLFPSEIHTIEGIGRKPGINVSELAIELGISKPAVSQLTKRLERKGLIKRYRDEGNNKEVLLRLSPKGEIDYKGHSHYHADMDKKFTKYLMHLDNSGRKIISTLGDIMKEYYEKIYVERTSK